MQLAFTFFQGAFLNTHCSGNLIFVQIKNVPKIFFAISKNVPKIFFAIAKNVLIFFRYCDQTVLPDMSILIGQKFENSNSTFLVIFI